MTDHPERAQEEGQAETPIVISGLDEAQPSASAGEPGNTTPTDEAVQRLQSQRPRGEPEDEDG